VLSLLCRWLSVMASALERQEIWGCRRLACPSSEHNVYITSTNA
jgi:hypothetical protein